MEPAESKHLMESLKQFVDRKIDAQGLVAALTIEMSTSKKEADPDVCRAMFERTSRVFAKALRMLKHQKDKSEGEITELVHQAKDAEEAHKEKVSDLTMSLNSIQSKLRRLDSRIAKVSHSAVRIGNQLEMVEQQRHNVEKGRALLRHFINFNSKDKRRLGPLFRDIPESETIEKHAFMVTPQKLENLRKAANVIQDLEKLCHDLRVAGTEHGCDAIEESSNKIENALHKLFEKTQSHDVMKTCAETLFRFNSGAVIQRFVYRKTKSLCWEPFVQAVLRPKGLSAEQLLARADEKTLQKRVVFKFFDLVSVTCRKQFKIIANLFPDPFVVMQAMLNQIFEVELAKLVDNTVKSRRFNERLQFMKFLCKNTVQFANHLQTSIFKPALALNPPKDSVLPQMYSLPDKVDGLLRGLREQYIQQELDQLSSSAKRLLDELCATCDQAKLGSGGEDKTLFGKVRRGKGASAPTKAWCMGMLAAQPLKELLEMNKMALQRSDTIAHSAEASANVCKIFGVLLRNYLRDHVQKVLEVALVELLPDGDPKHEPDTFVFMVVFRLTELNRLLVNYYSEEIVNARLSKDSANTNAQTILHHSLKSEMAVLASSVEQGLRAALTSALKWVSRLLNKQKSGAYRVKEQELLEWDCSPGVSAVVRFLDGQRVEFERALRGANRENFATMLGVGMHGLVEMYVRRLKGTLSTSDAMMLNCDLKALQEMANRFKVPSVQKLFERVRGIGNLFMVPFKALRDVVQRQLSSLSPEELQDFLRLRSDFAQNKNAMLQLVRDVRLETHA